MLFYSLLSTLAVGQQGDDTTNSTRGDNSTHDGQEPPFEPTHHGNPDYENLTTGGVIVRIIPFILLALLLLWCSCRVDQQRAGTESPRARQTRRDHLESLLIVKKVTTISKKESNKLTEYGRTESASLQQAEEGTVATAHDCESTSVGCRSVCASATTLHADREKEAATNDALYVKQGNESIDEKIPESVNDRESMSSTLVVPVRPREQDETTTDDETLAVKEGASTLPKPLASSNLNDKDEDDSTYQSSCTDISLITSAEESTANMTTERTSEQPVSCDICLMDYEVGDEICWSPNKECIHAFHKDCILDWLLRNSKCPECRREYLPETNENNGSKV